MRTGATVQSRVIRHLVSGAFRELPPALKSSLMRSVSMTRTPAGLSWRCLSWFREHPYQGAAGHRAKQKGFVGGRQLSEILLGYEVSTGNEVRVPFAHTVVCGQTQASGKTTTLEGMLSRTGDPPRPALAFLTKRAESAFVDARRIPPYFRDRADWQFVESILEAMMRERMKYQREWIIRVCQGAKSLEQVAANVELALHGDGKRQKKSASGYAAGMYLQLSEYFKLLMPELRRLKLDMATHGLKLALEPGLNVMELSEYSTEMQSLAIASAMEEVYRRRDVVTVIPEAWEFLPQGRNTPVKMAGEALIRKGAAAQNFMWLDSQDITGVDKRVLKQVGVWILGVQREVNEVEHTLSQMAVPKKLKPQPEDVMQLRRGQFFVCFEDVLKRVMYCRGGCRRTWDSRSRWPCLRKLVTSWSSTRSRSISRRTFDIVRGKTWTTKRLMRQRCKLSRSCKRGSGN